jgi:hypothetical protein
VPIGDYCDEYAGITCEAAERCGCLEGVPVSFCLAYQADECQGDVIDPVEAGRYAYDALEAGRCLAAMRSMLRDCTGESLYWPDACDDMLVGLVPEGGACDGDSECAGDLECYSDACTRLPREGEACLAGSDCASGHFCGDDVLCHRNRGAGQPCPEGDTACEDDLYCDSRTTTCEPYLGAGESCAHDAYACDDDLYCSPATSTCRPVPGAGGDCADSSGECADGSYCDVDDVCRAQRGGGQPCTEDEQCLSWECADGTCTEDPCGID